MIAISMVLAWMTFGAWLNSTGRRNRATAREQARLRARIMAGIRDRS